MVSHGNSQYRIRGVKCAHLEGHAGANECQHLGRVVERAVLVHECLLPAAGAAVGVDLIAADEALLHLGDVEEPGVGGVEEGDAKGQPDSHDPELDAGGHVGAIDVARLDGEPVQVEEDDGAKRQRKTTDAEDGHVTLRVEEGHATEEDQSPYDGQADVKDAEAVDRTAGVSDLKTCTHIGCFFSFHLVLVESGYKQDRLGESDEGEEESERYYTRKVESVVYVERERQTGMTRGAPRGVGQSGIPYMPALGIRGAKEKAQRDLLDPASWLLGRGT